MAEYVERGRAGARPRPLGARLASGLAPLVWIGPAIALIAFAPGEA